MKWNNRTIQQLANRHDPEAKKIYKDYREKTKKKKEPEPDNPEKIKEWYHSKPKEVKEDSNKPEKLFTDYKETPKKDGPYKILIGGRELPITPSEIPIQNPTEPKKFKTVTGIEIILGAVILPRIVTISSYFPYYSKEELKSGKTERNSKSSKKPKNYCDYFDKLRNKAHPVDFQITGFDTSFKVLVTTFDYQLIPGRDVEFTMTLTEALELNANEIDI